MVNKHKKTFSTSVAIRQMQTKTVTRYHYVPIRMVKKIVKTPNSREDVEKMGYSYITIVYINGKNFQTFPPCLYQAKLYNATSFPKCFQMLANLPVISVSYLIAINRSLLALYQVYVVAWMSPAFDHIKKENDKLKVQIVRENTFNISNFYFYFFLKQAKGLKVCVSKFMLKP